MGLIKLIKIINKWLYPPLTHLVSSVVNCLKGGLGDPTRLMGFSLHAMQSLACPSAHITKGT